MTNSQRNPPTKAVGGDSLDPGPRHYLPFAYEPRECAACQNVQAVAKPHFRLNECGELATRLLIAESFCTSESSNLLVLVPVPITSRTALQSMQMRRRRQRDAD